MANAVIRRLFGQTTQSIAIGAMVLAFVFSCGCGGKGAVDLDNPDQPGTAAELAGTKWTHPDTKVTYFFEDESNLQILNPDEAEPIYSIYSVDNGIVDLSVGLTSLNGTWDGEKLVLEGTTLTRE